MFFRIALLAGLAALATPAFACGGKTCGASSCNMPSSQAADAGDAVDQAAGDKAAFKVTGMKCGACADKINAALKAIEGVNASSVKHSDGMAKIAFDSSKTNAESLKAAIAGLGYTVEIADS